MEIRPYRRLAIPFELPYFLDLVDISDFVSPSYEHFGVARFGSNVFSYTSVPILLRMCKNLGLRLMVNCDDPSFAVQSAREGADFVVSSVNSVHTVTSARVPTCKVLVSVSDEIDLEFVKVSSADGVFCHSSLVAKSRKSLPAGSTVFASAGDAVSAVKDGADYVTVDELVFRSENPGKALRDLGERFREYT